MSLEVRGSHALNMQSGTALLRTPHKMESSSFPPAASTPAAVHTTLPGLQQDLSTNLGTPCHCTHPCVHTWTPTSSQPTTVFRCTIVTPTDRMPIPGPPTSHDYVPWTSISSLQSPAPAHLHIVQAASPPEPATDTRKSHGTPVHSCQQLTWLY